MYPYFNQQPSIDRINTQISELEKLRNQLSQPTSINQTFQLSPNQNGIRYADSLEQVEKEQIFGDTPFFSKDMSVLWLKSTSGEVKSYELNEIVEKDEKDLQIEFLMAQIEEMKGMIADAKSSSTDADEPTKSKKSPNVSVSRTSKKK